MINNYLKKFSSLCNLIFCFFFSKPNYIYKIEEINESSGRVIISCRGKNAIIITSIIEIVYDNYIIKEMPPHHACWIGYYYGKYKEKSTVKKYRNKEVLFPDYNNTVYQIHHQDREGRISYSNKNTNETFLAWPSELAHSEIIANFDSAQAYYIGYLSGLETIRNINKIKFKKNQGTHLRVVK